MLRMITLSCLAIALAFTLGCESTQPDEPGTPQPIVEQSLDGTYVVATVNGNRFLPAKPVLVTIGDGRISGGGPVNRWSGGLEDNKLGVMMSTKMAGPPAQMKLEGELFTALEGGSLVAKGKEVQVVKDGKTVATFEAVE